MIRNTPAWLAMLSVCVMLGCGGGSAPTGPAVADSNPAPTTPPPSMPSNPQAGGYEDDGMSGMADGMDDYGAGYGGYDDGNTDDTMDAGYMEEMAAAYEASGANYPGADGMEIAYPDDYGEGYGAAEGMADGMIDYGGYAEGYPGEGGGRVAREPPKTLDGKAKWSFELGKDRDAMQYLYAYALTSDEGAASVLSTMRWAPALRRPALAVRMGIGFEISGARADYTGTIEPVGSEQKLPTRGGPSRGESDYAGGDYGAEMSGDSAMADAYGGGGSSKPGEHPVLARNAGELGEKLIEGLRARLEAGDFGEVLKDALVGDPESESSERGPSSGYGMAGYPGGADDYGAGLGGYGGVGRAASKLAAGEVAQLLPGLTLLGLGDQKELLTRAKEQDLDALIFFDIKLTFIQASRLIRNDTTMSLWDVRDSKQLVKTSKLNNLDVQKARAAEKDDRVDKTVADLFDMIDQGFKLVDIPPQLNEEVATKRAGALITEKHENPLPVLAEIRMYHSKGLLDDNKLGIAYERVLGEGQGQMLLSGTEEDKLKVLADYLPQADE